MSAQGRGRARAAALLGGESRPVGLLAEAKHKSLRIVHRKPADLIAHQRNRDLFPEPISLGLENDLDESIKAIGITNPLLIAGTGCHSPRGTLYAGHRRRGGALRTGLPAVPCREIDGLSEDDEIALIIGSNLGEQTARKLSESTRFKLEEELTRILQRRPGRPSAGDASERVPVLQQVAKQLGTTGAAIRERRELNKSELFTPALKDALDSEHLSRHRALQIVRGVNKLKTNIDEKRAEVDRLAVEWAPRQRTPRAAPAPMAEPETSHDAVLPEAPNSKDLGAGASSSPNAAQTSRRKLDMAAMIGDVAGAIVSYTNACKVKSDIFAMSGPLRLLSDALDLFLGKGDELGVPVPRRILRRENPAGTSTVIE